MTSLFLGCFSFGLLFTVASFLLGAFGGNQDFNMPSIHGAGFHAAGGGSSGGVGHGDHGTHGSNGNDGLHFSPFNLSTASAFLAWFGGAGYLLTRYSGMTALAVTTIATAAGVAGGAVVFLVLARLVMPRLTVMVPEHYEMRGVVARVSSPIRPDGTGEIIYTLAGTRHSDGARSASAELLEKGTEVVILRVEKGIAYVERWTKFAETHQLPPGDSGVA